MTLFEAIILGIIQGATEFLPISSSGHLVVAERLLGLTNPETNLALIVFLHFASLMAIIVVFFTEILELFSRNLRVLFLIIIGTIPAVIIGLIFEKIVTNLFSSSIILVGIALWVTGLYLLIGEFNWQGSIRSLEKARIKSVLWIGLAQAMAIIPGFSRSGLTISTGFLTGIEKRDAVKFSFFLAIPVILGATIIKLKDFDKLITSFQPISILVSGVVCFLVSLIAIKLLLRIVQKGQLFYFAIYCFIIGLVIIVMGILGG